MIFDFRLNRKRLHPIENHKSQIENPFGPVVQRRRRLNDIQESDGSSPSGITVSLIREFDSGI